MGNSFELLCLMSCLTSIDAALLFFVLIWVIFQVGGLSSVDLFTLRSGEVLSISGSTIYDSEDTIPPESIFYDF